MVGLEVSQRAVNWKDHPDLNLPDVGAWDLRETSPLGCTVGEALYRVTHDGLLRETRERTERVHTKNATKCVLP